MADDLSLPIDVGVAVSATFDPSAGPAFMVAAAVVADVTISFPGITIDIGGIQQGLTIVELGLTTDGLVFKPPSWQATQVRVDGALSLDLPAISGGGEVSSTPDGSWAGGLQLALGAIGIDAFAVIGSHTPPSLAIVLCARFPLPGIQIGFGFAICGVGGVLAINRRSDRDALTAAILDGSIDALLFARNPQGDAGRIIANLPALFPDQPGQVVIGPMLEINWGAGLLTADVMVIIELPNPLQISLIGRLVVDLPFDEAGDDDIAIIHLEARVAAFITPSVPEVRVVASLRGSRILLFPVTGDLFLLIRGGPEATFVFSAGGFHPGFIPPPNVPPLQRVGMTMMLALIELRLAAYLAVTTSSVQLGASVELSASVAQCGLHGTFSFDALIDWKPQFHFLVDVHIALGVEIFGKNLCGVAFTGSLSGPGPWHLHGSGEVEVLWVTVDLPIDATFGSAPTIAPPPPLDIGPLLAADLGRVQSWTIHPPAALNDGVTLSASAHADLAAAQVLYPGGGVHVTERLLPLMTMIDRYAGQLVDPPQSWSITTVRFGAERDTPPTALLYDTFADGNYTNLTVEQQLTVNGFTSHPAGVDISPTGLMCGAVATQSRDWDDIVVDPVPDGGPTNSPLWALANLASLVPARGAAATFAVPGDPITVGPPQRVSPEQRPMLHGAPR